MGKFQCPEGRLLGRNNGVRKGHDKLRKFQCPEGRLLGRNDLTLSDLLGLTKSFSAPKGGCLVATLYGFYCSTGHL